jgi:phosphate starvation-inducible PhoH-like protein
MARRYTSTPESFSWIPATRNQITLRDTIRKKRITLAVGPAGTGKTFCTVCVAFEELFARRVSGIIVSRPLVPAGRDFGFLPGTLKEKIRPFLAPIHETIMDLNLPDTQSILEGLDDTIECVPLELMRGRTFTEKFIIIDEAQNATPKQIEMAMTRLGRDSRMVFCGDINQTDLRVTNGLLVALNLFKLEEEFGIVKFGLEDIQREGITRIVIEKFGEYFENRL